MKKLFVFIIVLFAFGVFFVQPSSVHAAEGGVGHYGPGGFADFGDMAPPPGVFALINWYNYYNGSAGASAQLPLGGIFAANISATCNAEMFGAAYTTPYGILGGKFAVAAFVPYIWMDVKGTITGPRGRTFTRTDTANGIGDFVFVPFWLNWTRGDFKWAVQLDIYAPTGEYNTGQLANVGLNYWTFEPLVSFSWISKKIGLEISSTAGFDFNTIKTQPTTRAVMYSILTLLLPNICPCSGTALSGSAQMHSTGSSLPVTAAQARGLAPSKLK